MSENTNTQKARLYGGKQLWIIIFAGFMYLLTGSIAAGNTNTVLPYIAGLRGWLFPSMIIFVSLGGYVSVAANFGFGQLLMKIGAKKVIIIGLIGGGISALLFGLTNNFAVFAAMIILNFFFAGAYQAAGVNALLAIWFPKKKGVIFGWSTMGLVVASVTYAPYITKLFDKIGLGTTYIGIAVIFWILAILCIFTVKDTPEEAGTYPDGDPNTDKQALAKVAMEFAKYKSPFTLGKLFGRKETWQLMFGWGLPWFGMMAVFSQLVPRLIQVGYSPDFASLVLAIAGFIALPGSWLFGWLDTKIGCKKSSIILGIILLIGCVAAFLHPAGMFFVWLCAATMALGQGAMANLVPSMIASWFGRWDFPAASRLLFPLVNIVATAGMTLVGVFLSHNIPFSTLYIVSAVVTAIGVIIMFTVKEEMIGKAD